MGKTLAVDIRVCFDCVSGAEFAWRDAACDADEELRGLKDGFALLPLNFGEKD